MSDLNDDFDDDFNDEDADAKRADESEKTDSKKGITLEKRLLIDNLLEEKRLAKVLQDDFDDVDDDDFDDGDDEFDD